MTALKLDATASAQRAAEALDMFFSQKQKQPTIGALSLSILLDPLYHVAHAP